MTASLMQIPTLLFAGIDRFWGEATHAGFLHSSLVSVVLAQQVNTNLVTNVQNAFNNFIESGQVWAFAIGLIIGYLFRMLTTYGG